MSWWSPWWGPFTLLIVLPPSIDFSSGTWGNQMTSGFEGSTVSVE